MRRFHYAYAHHDWGIVVGLGLKVEGGVVQIYDGGGIDGYGREVLFGQEATSEASDKDAPLPYSTWSIDDITAGQGQPPNWI